MLHTTVLYQGHIEPPYDLKISLAKFVKFIFVVLYSRSGLVTRYSEIFLHPWNLCNSRLLGIEWRMIEHTQLRSNDNAIIDMIKLIVTFFLAYQQVHFVVDFIKLTWN